MLPQNAQIEYHAPLSGVTVRLERHSSPAWGITGAPAPGPNAAELAAVAEEQKTAHRRQTKGEHLARFHRDLVKRVSSASAARRKSDEQPQQARQSHYAEPTTGERTCRSYAIADRPASLLEARVGQVQAETALARRLMMGGALSAASVDAEPAAPRSSLANESYGSTGASSTPLVAAVRSEWASTEREAARARRAGQQREAQQRGEAAKRASAQAARAAVELAGAHAREDAWEAELSHRREAEETERMLESKALRERADKAMQAERYIEARRAHLRQEVALRKRPLPRLCCCGLDALDNHVDNCATNCVFYKNPQAYSRALSGLFVRAINLT